MDREELHRKYYTDIQILDDVDEMELGKALAKYNELILDLYWKSKDLKAVVDVGKRAFRLAERKGEPSHPRLSPIGYNIASFTAPWWSDSIPVTPQQARFGLDIARLTLELRLHGGFDPIKISGIRWLIGVHQLYTMGDREAALKEFKDSKRIAMDSEDETKGFMDACTEEGIGRTEYLLGNKEVGYKHLRWAEEKYSLIDDNYSIAELKYFLDNST